MYEAQEIVDNYRFKLIRKIAEGGMGTVHEALQYGTDEFTKRVAIKTLNREVSTDEEFVGMFVGEAKLVANLVHQNIVQIYQLGRSHDQFYIAMEYISGVNLQEFLDRHADLSRRIPVDTAAFVVSRICRGLEYAHQSTGADGKLLGVVHRDISPKNIMMTWQGVVKIADWGIAKARAIMSDREGDILLGKSQYMSPEQAGFQATDARSDLFSLGIVFYELLAGGPLFDDDETIVILDKVMNADVTPIRKHCPELPPEIERILMMALAQSRSKRYQSAKQMGDDLEHYMYDKGFGPTNQTLAAHLRETFPDKASL